MQIVPLQAVPSQIVNVGLANQQCTISVYQRTTGLFFDLTIAGGVIITSVLCLNQNLLVRNTYLGLVGDLAFFDTQGVNDPVYTGLGSRYQLVYLAVGDITGLPPGVGGQPPTAVSSPSVGAVAPVTTPSNVGRVTNITVTLVANATTTVVIFPSCSLSSVIVPSPLTPDASNDMATMSFVVGVGKFTINHASNARIDRTFNFLVVG